MAADSALERALRKRTVSSGPVTTSAVLARLRVWWPAIAVCLVTVAALVYRVRLALGDSLPLGDGGMFYDIIEQLKTGGYGFSDYVTYNAVEIPFVYSPLTFYLAAAISEIPGLDTLTVLRFLPVIVSCLTIPAFYLLARAVLRNDVAAVAATSIYALDAGFLKLIMGGGLTRSFGLLFALLAIYHLHRLTKDDPSVRRVVFASGCMSLTLLSHQEMAWIAGLFYFVFLCASIRSPQDLLPAIGATALTLAITLPWWLLNLDRHGLEPFLGALDSGNVNTLAPLGLLFIPLSRKWLLPALLVATTFFGGRNLDFPEGIVVSLIFGSVCGWLAARLSFGEINHAGGRMALLLVKVSAVAIAVSVLAATRLVSTDEAADDWISRSAGEAESFAWIQRETAPDSRFVVIADTDEWGYDHTGEWLPSLTGRQSISTIQGREWLRGPEGYPAAKAGYGLLRECVTSDSTCIEAWQPVQGLAYTHVYITKDGCCSVLRDSLATSDGYALVYDGAGAQIFERLKAPEE